MGREGSLPPRLKHPPYDGFGRMSKLTVKRYDLPMVTTTIGYEGSGSTTSGQVSSWRNVVTDATTGPNSGKKTGDTTYSYTYDQRGNITKITDGTYATTYKYDVSGAGCTWGGGDHPADPGNIALFSAAAGCNLPVFCRLHPHLAGDPVLLGGGGGVYRQRRELCGRRAAERLPLSGVALIGAGLVLAGLSVFLLFRLPG